MKGMEGGGFPYNQRLSFRASSSSVVTPTRPHPNNASCGYARGVNPAVCRTFDSEIGDSINEEFPKHNASPDSSAKFEAHGIQYACRLQQMGT